MRRHVRIGNPSRRNLNILLLLLSGLLGMAGFGNETLNAQERALDAVKKRGVLRAGIRTDNPPHSFIDDKGRWVGFDIDIAVGLAKELGVKLEKVKVDELTRISYLKTGQIDVAVASMSHTIKRDMEVDFSQTYFWSKQTFLVRKGAVKSLRDLVGKRVGMSRGSHAIGNWRDWLKKQGHAFDSKLIMEFNNKQAAGDAVRQGAIEGYAEDYEVLSSLAKRESSLTVLNEAIGMKQDGIGVRENDSKIRDAVNFALQRLAKSGLYDKIYDQWFGPNSDTPVPRSGEIEVWPDG